MNNMGLNVLTNESIGISPIEYINHSFTPDSCMNDQFHSSKDCMIDLKLIFNLNPTIKVFQPFNSV